MPLALLLLASYLLGSIPFGMLVGRACGVDIRKHGSGNIGATNVFRVLGPGPALVVFLGDTLKGLLPVLAGRHLLHNAVGPGHLVGQELPAFAAGVASVEWAAVGQGLAPAISSRVDLWLLAIGLAAILGHTFSVFLGFRGGRAVATTLGVLLGMTWLAGVVGLVIWIVVVVVTRYISVASIVAACSVPVFLALTGTPFTTTLFWLAIVALIILRHIPNLGRLLEGTESKIGQRVRL